MFAIGRQGVFSLAAWSPPLHAKFPVHRVTQGHPCGPGAVFGQGPFTRCGAAFHPLNLTVRDPAWSGALQPPQEVLRVWALPASLAATDGIDFSLSVPPVTEMFHFTGCCLAAPGPLQGLWAAIAGRYAGGVTPFGHPRVNARWPLAVVYRSLPRPSSPLGAKASMIRPW